MLGARKGDVDRDLVICPYNHAHVIVSSRLANHLIKCSKNYPESNLVACPYNSCHIVANYELEYHTDNCPDRRKYDRFFNTVGVDVCPVKNEVPIHPDVPEAEENWDDVPVGGPSPLDAIQQNVVNKPVLRTLQRIGKTRSERKAFDAEEKRRLMKLEEDKLKIEKTKKNENTKMTAKKPLIDNNSNEVGENGDENPVRAPKETLSSKAKRIMSRQAKLFDGLSVPSTSQLSEATGSVSEPSQLPVYEEIDSLSSRLGEMNTDDTFDYDSMNEFGSESYFGDDMYMGGYSLPKSSAMGGGRHDAFDDRNSIFSVPKEPKVEPRGRGHFKPPPKLDQKIAPRTPERELVWPSLPASSSPSSADRKPAGRFEMDAFGFLKIPIPGKARGRGYFK